MTLEELKACGIKAQERLEKLKSFLKIDEKNEERAVIEEVMSESSFWDNQEKAQETVANLSSLKNVLEPFSKLCGEIEDFEVMWELVADDPDMLEEAEGAWNDLVINLDKLELVSFLSGKFDKNSAYFSINAGAGGTESCDWAAMLLRMYRRFFEKRGWSEEVIEMQSGDEAGIKSATLKVTGDFAYGYTKAEKGVHRLVRISPFDSNARRHTSFCSVDVFPELNDDIDIEIEEKDLRVDTFRASGAGGQHVNTTDSAIRITHIPSGIAVACQNQRSQHKNRATAMGMLKAQLYEMEQEKQRAEADSIRGEKSDNSWGSQIRSYVLHPYQMVKDLRTNVETGNTSAVLDGDIDMFIEAWIKSSD